jgi:hypothetical protein
MRVPDRSLGGVARPSGSAEIDFLIEKEEGRVKLGWVCYIQNEQDEVMNPNEFNLRIVSSVARNPFTYTGSGEDFGYRYNVFTAEKSRSAIDSPYKIIFNTYIDIPSNAVPGRYKVVLEIADWDRVRGSLVSSPTLGNIKPKDVNYIKFEVIP